MFAHSLPFPTRVSCLNEYDGGKRQEIKDRVGPFVASFLGIAFSSFLLNGERKPSSALDNGCKITWASARKREE